METELARLRAAFETMPEEERAVFSRCRFGGENYHQIAEELGISIAEVERRLAAAMLHLRRALDDGGS